MNVQKPTTSVRKSGMKFTRDVWILLMIASVQTVRQCSNCLEGNCNANGECRKGCVPGFVDIYCREKCPSNCINKTCYLDRQKGSYVCIDGCQDGYCGSSCKRDCPNNCTTCDRASCSVCDVKPCAGNRYGAECVPCPTNYEKCHKDTGKCIKCKKGFYGENCETPCPHCLPGDKERKQGCETGCDVCSSDPCPNGFYGSHCDMVCSANCHLNLCDRTSGLCTEGCKAWYYGDKCNAYCDTTCVKATCVQNSGNCMYGCIDGYEQTDSGCRIKGLPLEVITGMCFVLLVW